MNRLLERLAGGDLRSLGNANAVVKQVHSQHQFDELLEGLFHEDRLIVMRAADAVEKVTHREHRYLEPHKKALLGLLGKARDKELKWHLALLVSRLKLTRSELGRVWATLTGWALDRGESRIVRVNSVQGLFDLLEHSPGLRQDFERTLTQLEREEIPSLTARIRKLRAHRDPHGKKGRTHHGQGDGSRSV
jgi:hypothetical protein